MWTLLTGLLWGTTFVMAPTWANGFWTPKAMVWLVGAFWLVAMGLTTSVHAPSPPNPWRGWLLAWIMGSFAWHVLWPQVHIPNHTLTNASAEQIPIPWVWYPILPTFITLGSLLAVETLRQHTDTLQRWVVVAETLCWIGGTVAVYALAQWLWLDPFRMAAHITNGYILQKNSPITTFGNPMLTANMLALCAPFCLMFRPLRFKFLYGVMAGVLLGIGNRSSLLALGGSSLCFYSLIRDWKKLWVVLGSMGIFVGNMIYRHAGFSFFNSDGRLAFWGQLLDLWKRTAPWTGVGLGGIEFAASQGLWHWASAHNEFLQILFELGLIGLVLTLLALGTTCRRLLRTPMSIGLAGWVSAAVSFGIISCFGFPLRIGSMLAVGVCIWAALDAHTGGTYAT